MPLHLGAKAYFITGYRLQQRNTRYEVYYSCTRRSFADLGADVTVKN